MTNLDPQPAIPNVPAATATPDAYISPGDAEANLLERWGLTASLNYGHVLTASLACDQEGPFLGVKFVIEQEREWPRTFKYGWPALVATPEPVMVAQQYPGAFYLNYEGVVPYQIVDWVCLEAYRYVTLPFDRAVVSESVTGASVHYAPPPGEPNGQLSQLDHIQNSLISPFQARQAHTNPILLYGWS